MWRTSIALLVVTTATARADTDGDAALAKIDAALGTATATKVTWDVTSTQVKHKAQHKVMTIMAKGGTVYAELDDVPSAGFLSRYLNTEADAAGMRFVQPGINDGSPRSSDRRILLIEGNTLPDVAFNPDDWSLSGFASRYAATLGTAKRGEIALVLAPKAGVDAAGIEKIEIVAKADTKLPIAVSWYAGGKPVRADKRGNYKCDAGRCVARTREIVTPKVTSKFVAKTVGFDVPDDQLTPAYLAR